MSKPRRFLTSLLCSAILLATNTGSACTAFSLKYEDDFVVGKNYDWFRSTPHGALFTNARNLKKTAADLTKWGNPAQWVSKYGSITFTQFGRELPISGINEQGLVVEILKLAESKYNSSEKTKPFVNESQFAQYLLDNYKDLDETLKDINNIRVEKDFAGLHYFVCDAKAKCAIFEFLNGTLHTYTDETLPVPALTNHPYEVLLRDFKQTEIQQSYSRVAVRSSKYRFWKTAQMLNNVSKKISEPSNTEKSVNGLLGSYAFEILEQVQLKFGTSLDGVNMVTQWRIVYHPNERTVFFKTRNSTKLKSLKLEDFDFSCQTHGRMLDMNADFSGPVKPHLVDFSYELNASLIEKNAKLLSKAKIAAAKEVALTSECIPQEDLLSY